MNFVKPYWSTSRLNQFLRKDNPKPRFFEKERIEFLYDEEGYEIAVEFQYRLKYFPIKKTYGKVYHFKF